jgi:hypothetical protein
MRLFSKLLNTSSVICQYQGHCLHNEFLKTTLITFCITCCITCFLINQRKSTSFFCGRREVMTDFASEGHQLHLNEHPVSRLNTVR